MAEVRVGAVEHEEVREARDADAEVRLRAVLPDLLQQPAVGPRDLHRHEERRALEAGGDDDDVHGAGAAVAGHDRVLGHALDRAHHDLDVVPVERLVVVVGDEDALAADRVVGHEHALQRRIGHRRADVLLGHAGDHAAHEAVPAEDREALLVLEPEPPAV